MLPYPIIDPIAIHIPAGWPGAKHGGIRWYALAYLTGVLAGWWLLGRLNKRLTPPTLSKEAFDDIMVWAILGIILGGRLGYVLFYKFDYYFANPGDILRVWEGGMSFHGGLLGVITAMFLFARKYRVPFFAVTDLMAVVAPIGLFLGRIANFINGELFGRVTDSPLGMIFPNGGPEPRYPSQLFEAGLEGVVLFIVLFSVATRTRALARTGLLSGLFLICYCCARSTCELFREPDEFIHFLPHWITMGQLLSIPMLLFGLYLVARSRDAVRT
jgi:phosphatidylglycerol:prolipoprotein diacylglycerol transferase